MFVDYNHSLTCFIDSPSAKKTKFGKKNVGWIVNVPKPNEVPHFLSYLLGCLPKGPKTMGWGGGLCSKWAASQSCDICVFLDNLCTLIKPRPRDLEFKLNFRTHYLCDSTPDQK